MKSALPIYLFILAVPIYAWLDVMIFGGASFQYYLKRCAFEMTLAVLGILIGFKFARKQK